MALRDDLHRAIDGLPDEQLLGVRAFLDRTQLPADGEPLTERDLQAIAESRADLARGEYVSLDELKRGLTTG